MAVSRKGAVQKKMPPGNALVTKRMSAGPVDNPDNAVDRFRPNEKKRKAKPTPAPIPPQPFAPPAGEKVPV